MSDVSDNSSCKKRNENLTLSIFILRRIQMNSKFTLEDLTRQNKVTKSLQLEIIPEGKTGETIENKGFLDTDAMHRDLVSKISPYVDSAIRKVSNTALSDMSIDFSVDAEEEEITAKIKSAANKALLKAVKDLFGLSLKQINSAKFLHDALPEHIAEMDLAADEKAAALDLAESIKGKTEIITSFLITRITALEVWMPERVAENWHTYKKNINIFEKLIKSDIGADLLRDHPCVSGFVDAKNYNNYLSQNGINEYNLAINGLVTVDGIKKKGIRQLVNEYNQKNKGNNSLPMPKELYKQILEPTEKAFSIRTISTDEELKEVTFDAKKLADEATKDIMDALKDLTGDDLAVRYNKLHALSHLVTGNHKTIPDAIKTAELNTLVEEYESAPSKREAKVIEKRIAGLDKALLKMQWTFDEIEKLSGVKDLVKTYKTAINSEKSFIDGLNPSAIFAGPVRGDENATLSLKEYFDAWTTLRDLFRLIMRSDTDKGDNAFYEVLGSNYRNLNATAKAQGLAVAYITRKPKDASKNDLASMGTAARSGSAWLQPDGILDINKFTILSGADGKLFLYMLAPGTKPVSLVGSDKDNFVFAQKKAQDAKKFLPRLTFTYAKKFFEKNPNEDAFVLSKKLHKPMTITRALFDIKDKNLYTTGALKDGTVTEEEFKDNLAKILQFYKDFVANYEEYDLFNIKYRYDDVSDYKNSEDFFEDINACNIKAMWLNCDREKMEKLVDSGDALMFLISSRFLYRDDKKSAYTEVLKTALFENADIFLSSSPKMFYRKATITKPIVHKKGSILVNKRDKNGNAIPDDIYEEIYRFKNNLTTAKEFNLSKEAQRYLNTGLVVTKKATHDIVKDKRYTENKWFIQFSYTKNRSVVSGEKSLNSTIRENLPNMNVISVIRSATDLIYYMVQAPDGTILEKQSLNVINGYDYWAALKETSDERKREKSEEWKYGRKVADQRDAYLSQAITVLCRKVIEYDAVLCLEYIQPEVKNKFDAIDNSVMKKFESLLTARLSDLYFMDKACGEPGSVDNPYQLCDNTGNDFQDGIVFFTGAAYTGNVDKETGFVNIFDYSRIVSGAHRKAFLAHFDSIKYSKTKDRFIFSFDYDNFVTRDVIKNTAWQITAGGPAVNFDREHKRNVYVPETASAVVELLLKHNRELSDDFAKNALDKDKMTVEEACAFYDIFRRAVSGIVKAHDGVGMTYISPVTGKIFDANEVAAENLARKFRFIQEENLKDKKDRESWLANIAK